MSMLKDLMKRCKNNPIIKPGDIPGASTIFNCGATKFKDKYILLVSATIPGNPRVGKAMYLAESKDGINFEIEEKPFISPSEDPFYSQFDYDICDPRITHLENTYYITYPAHDPKYGVVGILGKTEDFKKFERIGVIALPDNRCPVLFPEKIGDFYVRLDRPFGVYSGTLWLSYSRDLIYWGNHKPLIQQGEAFWNNFKVGPGAPPIRTKEGWLVIYHTVSGGKIGAPFYSLACALLDLKDPSRVIANPDEYLITPEEPYERVGLVHNVVFTCGAIADDDGELKLYYGAADTCIGLATCDIDELLKYLT